MQTLLRYPKGYLTKQQGTLDRGSPGIEIVPVKGDDNLISLYKIYQSPSSPWRKWAFKRTVIQECARLFGDFYYWLDTQFAENDCVYGLNLEFLIDTVNYIRTGHRRMQLVTWQPLLLEYQDPQLGCANKRRMAQLKLGSYADVADAISKWCAHPDGFDDMFTTAFILFGKPRNEVNTNFDRGD